MPAAPRAILDFISHSPDQTRRFGSLLGGQLQAGDVVLLSGTLGAGKTTLIQGLAHGLAVESDVLSPTFTIAMEHEGVASGGQPLRVYHIDLYRLGGSDDELDSIGFDEYLDDPGGLVIIEWPERAPQAMPEHFLMIELERIAESKRRISVLPAGKRYQDLAVGLRSEVGGARG